MPSLVKAPATYTYGSGNNGWIKQVKRNGDGTFTSITGTDVLGELADTWHDIGTLLESPISRGADGFHQVDFKVGEDDIERKQFILQVAPFSNTTQINRSEVLAEDETVFVRGSEGEDITRPYFQIAKIEKNGDDSTKQTAFYGVGQFSLESKRDNKPNTLNTKDYKFKTVDAKGYVCTNPADAIFTGITAPTLSGDKAAGWYVNET